MGVRQSRRSVDITTTPKKEGVPAEGGVGDAAAPGDGKLERIEETDTKPTTNGIAPHTDVTEDKDDATEKEKEKEKDKKKEKEKPEDVKAEETKQESTGESPAETVEATTPTEATPASPNTATSPDSKETKKKDKMKKKWSFRSISFSKKDKSKPAREEAPKNGDVTKEEPLAEGGEEAENGSATAGSPVEDKSAVSSLSEEKEAAAPVSAAEAAAAAVSATAATTETKEDAPAASVASSPADEQQEEPTPSAPTPVPVEEKKEEVEKVEAEKKVVEVSRAGDQSVPDPVEVQTVATPSIIERKTSEDIPSLPPSSPPPTPIDPSPLQQAQQAQQAAATATALAEALKLPAEAAGKDIIAPALSSLPPSSPERNGPSTPPAESLDVYPQRSTSCSTDEPPTESTTPAPPKPEALPVVDTDTSNTEVAVKTSSKPVTGHDSQIPALQTPSVSQSDAQSLDAPAAQQQDSPLSPQNEEELVTEAPAEAVDSEKACEIKAEEKSEPLVVVGTLEKPVAVEEPPVQRDLACDVASAPFAGNQEPEMATESVATEEPVVCDGEKRPEMVNLAEHVEELAEELVESDTVVQEGTASVEQVVIGPPVLVSDSFLESEEGLVPISEEILVEAKPAVVIPEDEETVEEEEVVDTDADADAEVSKVETESVEVIPDVEDKLEMETEFDIAAPSAESLVFEELEDTFPLNEEDIDSVQPVVEANTIIEESDEKRKDVRVIAEAEEAMPSPPESSVPSPHEHYDSENAVIEDDPTTVPSLVDVEPHIVEVEKTTEVEESPSRKEDIQMVMECSLLDCPVPPTEASSPQPLGSPMRPVVEKDASLANEFGPPVCPRLERVPTPAGDLSAAVQDTISQHVDSMEYPLPPEELSCPLITSSNVPEMKKSEPPVPDQSASASILRNPTETLLTPPRSPSPQSNVSVTSGQTTSTKDSSQTQFYDDQSNREFKMESVSISLNSYNDSEIELKERLAESLAKTVNQEESSVSCQLSNKATSSTTVQETHQSTPEPEAPVENNVAHDSTTESSDDTKKVTPPAVPTEVPASPPSAPVITEDVASVAKAIEEIDISDKAVAAATIECNTNEIIADAHYQNNINE